jgi:Arylsulfatase A and related enzymes
VTDDANVLVVVLDSVRAANTAPGRGHKTLSRVRRRLRDHGGVRYADARAPAVWSYPSHVSLFTGLAAGAHRVDTTETTFDSNTETLFGRLGKRGYSTGLFSTNPFLSAPEWNLQAGFDVTNPGVDIGDGRLARLSRVLRGRSAARVVCEAVEQWVDNRSGGQWAAFVNLMDAHSPYVPVRGHVRGRWRDLLRARRRGYGEGETETFERSDAEFRAMERLYEGCIGQCDAAVAWLLDALADGGMLADTHVVVTSDHGEGFGEPNEVDGSPVSFHWNAVNEENLHVPLYEHPPRAVDGLSVRDGLVSLQQLPAVLLGDGSFEIERCTAEHLYGGNVTTGATWSGEHARVLYQQTDAGVHKYVDDPRGVVAVEVGGDGPPTPLDVQTATVRDRVETAFEALPESSARADTSVDQRVRDRLSRLGYA